MPDTRKPSEGRPGPLSEALPQVAEAVLYFSRRLVGVPWDQDHLRKALAPVVRDFLPAVALTALSGGSQGIIPDKMARAAGVADLDQILRAAWGLANGLQLPPRTDWSAGEVLWKSGWGAQVAILRGIEGAVARLRWQVR